MCVYIIIKADKMHKKENLFFGNRKMGSTMRLEAVGFTFPYNSSAYIYDKNVFSGANNYLHTYFVLLIIISIKGRFNL